MRLFAFSIILIKLLLLPLTCLAQERVQIGVVAALDGTLTLRYGSISRQVRAGDKLLFGDQIITDQTSKAQILLKDRTALTIAPNTELLIDEFVYDPNAERNVTSRLLEGAVKISSPRLLKSIKSKRKLLMPNATVSIRGTEFLAQVNEGDDFVVLLTGLIDVENLLSIQELAKPNFGVSINDAGIISAPEFLDDKALGAIFSVFTPQNLEKTGQNETEADAEQTESNSQQNNDEENKNETGNNVANTTSSRETQTTNNAEQSVANAEGEADNNLEAPVAVQDNVAASDPVTSEQVLSDISVALAAPVEPVSLDIILPIEAVNNQITQELNEVLETVSSAVSEDSNNDPSTTDSDGDGVYDDADAFPNDPTETVDTDGDGIGNNADMDDDGDGVADSSDPNPLVNDTLDTDGDGTLDIVDTDDDGDGVADSADAFPLDSTESVDTDGDGIGNNADSDDDGDGVADTLDPNPLTTDTLDTDGDGTLDIVDTDDDGDGVPDSSDAFPLDNTESADSDGDGTGDNADTLDNTRIVKAPTTSSSSSGWTSSSWNDLASEIGTGTATFTATSQAASHVSGSNCTGCSAVVDTTLTIDFSDMDRNYTAVTTFTKPSYNPETFTTSSGDIPLGQYSLSSGTLTNVNLHNDLDSLYRQETPITFTLTSDPSTQITADMSTQFYYDGYQSDTSDISSTNLGVTGYTKIIYDDANSGIDQLNTPSYAMDPQ